MKNLSDFLVEEALQTEAARERLLHALQRDSSPLTRFLSSPYVVDESHLGDVIDTAIRVLILLAALRDLTSGVAPDKVQLLEIKLPARKKPAKARAAAEEAEEPAKGYPGQVYGLAAEQSALTLAQVLPGEPRVVGRVATVLEKHGLKTFGQLVEYTHLVPARLLSIKGIGAAVVAMVAAALRAQGLEPKEPKRGKAKAEAAPAASTPWQEYGLTEKSWVLPLKSLFPKDGGRHSRKVRKLTGRKKVTVGQLCESTQLKMARIGKFFGRGCGPDTRKFIRQTVLALATPIEAPAVAKVIGEMP